VGDYVSDITLYAIIQSDHTRGGPRHILNDIKYMPGPPTGVIAFRTGVAESSICACKTDNETLEHVLFCCANHDHCRTQLMDVVVNIWTSVTAKNFVTAKHTC